MKIVYIHGFNSGGSGNEKAAMLAEYFGADDVVAPDLPPSPDAAIAVLTDLVSAHDKDDVIVVGTSLGGFYAHYLSKTLGVKAVLINPSMDPATTLASKVGKLKNYATGVEYDFTAEHVEQLRKYYVDPASARIPTLLAIDIDDEMLNPMIAIDLFRGHAKHLIFKGGNHRFTHMAEILPEIAWLEHVVYD